MELSRVRAENARLKREDMTATAFEYIEVFYNRRRLHSTLGYKSPALFLQNWLTAQQMEKQVA